jgi:hypothetical protein
LRSGGTIELHRRGTAIIAPVAGFYRSAVWVLFDERLRCGGVSRHAQQ